MKTLLLVRHAKAVPDAPPLPDRDRPLDERGLLDAPKMGKRLAQRDLKPDLIVTSPARRALTTAQLIGDEIGADRRDIAIDGRLYASSAGELLAVIRALDTTFDQVMLVGHNPEFTELAHRLSNQITEMPTCAVAEFGFDIEAWSAVGDVAPSKVRLDEPKA